MVVADYAVQNMPKTTERNFEDDVECYLEEAGWTTFQEERYQAKLNDQDIWGVAQRDYDRKRALKTESLLGFIRDSQPEEWAKVKGLYGTNAEAQFLKRVCDVLEPHEDRDGLISRMRKGFDMAPGAHFRLCYFKPASAKNPDAQARYEANRFEVVRQLRYGTLPEDERNSIDTVLFVNGIPLVTMELKNNLTGQRTDHAVDQYKKDRSSKELIFKPNRRSIVHFAVDQETVEMCTWLANGKSVFLPFNKGNGMNGGGNPPNPGGYRTEYLYREVLAPESLLDILQRFVRVEYARQNADGSGPMVMKKVIFPRYHQLDAVRSLVADAKANGAGKSYLIQHSAGSGKSNSIAWLAHHLQSLHDDADNAVFDTVVVLTDRRNLDTQLSRTIEEVDHVKGVVVPIRDSSSANKDALKGSAGLREALNSGAQIITSTIQKFPYICAETKVSGRRFAVIIDEAHSSQSGKANAKMKLALVDKDVDPDTLDEAGNPVEPWDGEDQLAADMAAQGHIPNLSFFAFTATPKAATLEVFGTRDELCETTEDGVPIPRPFHLYSMKQAIEEGFILDVLENYTVYDTYFKLMKTIEDDPRYGEVKANRVLKSIVGWNERTIAKKAEIIVEHFMRTAEGLLDHRAKAMVVTSSRPMAYRLYRAINAYVEREGYACKTMIAFSGTLDVDGQEVTEAKLNGVPETRTAEVFDEDASRIIVCANKFQTGFDQPKLCAMYVDKILTGVAAVQTLSRLNRPHAGKRTFVLDFVNDWDSIAKSFSTYYEATELEAVSDPSVVYDLKERLDSFDVYQQVEVDAVADVYYAEPDASSVLRKVEARLQPAVDRWTALDDEQKRVFKQVLKKFLRCYSFITQMCRLGDEGLQRFFVYGGFLIKKLFMPVSAWPELRDKVELEYLRIEDAGTRSIQLESKKLPNSASHAGAGGPEDEEYLSVLVKRLNEAYGTVWEDADKIIKACEAKIMENEDFVAKARANTLDDLRAIFGNVMLQALTAILTESQDMTETFNKNPDAFMEIMNDNLLPVLYRKCNEG